MYSNKIFCAPIYRDYEHIRHAALRVLKDLEALEDSKLPQWVDASTIFLNKDGSFSPEMIDKRSFRGRALEASQKASLFMVNLFSSQRFKASEEEEQRLHHARRRLLVSLLAHAWLWERPNVLDNHGNPVAFKDRRVLAPEDILKFLSNTRVHTARCGRKDVGDFLKKVSPTKLLWFLSETTGRRSERTSQPGPEPTKMAMSAIFVSLSRSDILTFPACNMKQMQLPFPSFQQYWTCSSTPARLTVRTQS
jgi:hypothetical protein